MSAGADAELTRADRDDPYAGHASGVYTGVVPPAAPSPASAAPAHKGPPIITWPGFQMLPDGSSRVFIQATAPLEPEVVRAAEGTFELLLKGARVQAQTNRLPFDTRYFNTPVTKVSLSVTRSGATLVLELRAPVTPRISSERGSSGYYFTLVDLPKGAYVKGAGTPDDELPTLQGTKPGSKVIGKSAAAQSGQAGEAVGARGEIRAGGGLKLQR